MFDFEQFTQIIMCMFHDQCSSARRTFLEIYECDCQARPSLKLRFQPLYISHCTKCFSEVKKYTDLELGFTVMNTYS